MAARLARFPVVGTWTDFDAKGAEGRYGREMEIYLKMCERWRNLPKPTIAEVQGKCIAGGLMLAWVCDLIMASDDATFKDPVIDFGMPGVEFFMHPWELGIRKGKEFLFTADELGAEEAKACGMVNHVVPRDRLSAETLALAEKSPRSRYSRSRPPRRRSIMCRTFRGGATRRCTCSACTR